MAVRRPTATELVKRMEQIAELVGLARERLRAAAAAGDTRARQVLADLGEVAPVTPLRHWADGPDDDGGG